MTILYNCKRLPLREKFYASKKKMLTARIQPGAEDSSQTRIKWQGEQGPLPRDTQEFRENINTI